MTRALQDIIDFRNVWVGDTTGNTRFISVVLCFQLATVIFMEQSGQRATTTGSASAGETLSARHATSAKKAFITTRGAKRATVTQTGWFSRLVAVVRSKVRYALFCRQNLGTERTSSFA